MDVVIQAVVSAVVPHKMISGERWAFAIATPIACTLKYAVSSAMKKL